MNTEDTARCQQAIDLANSGMKQLAYEQFCALHQHGNTENVTLLYWIAYTTPSLEEAQRTIVSIARLEPDHPKLQELQEYVDRMQQKVIFVPPPEWAGPVMTCPYCHHTGPSRITRKISVGGWIWFSIFFLLFLCCMFALVPTSRTSAMGCIGFFLLLVGLIGLFMKKRSYTCGNCGITLGAIS